MTAAPVLQLKDIRKNFDAVVAIENFSLDIYPGEIVALVGDNGAGKSTLVKIVSGVYAPSSGSITIEGETVSMSSATMARSHGIEVVYQDLALADQQTVYMNMFLGRELTNSLGLLDRSPDYGPRGGPLNDPARRASCLSGLGYPASMRVLGAQPVDINARPGVVLVLPGETPASLTVFAVSLNCSAADTGLLVSTQVPRT